MGRIGRSKAGYYHGGANPPTGYNYINGQLVVDEYKALQVREVFDRFLSGYSINSIQRYMNIKYGGWTSHTLIINVLRNNVYIGKVKFKKVAYDGVHTPIVSASVFNRTQELLTSTKREARKTIAQKTPFRASYLLSSLIVCDKCGARYSGNHGYYKCYSRSKSDAKYVKDPNCKNKNWAIDKLDDLIIGEIEKLSQDPCHIDSMFTDDKDQSFVDVKSLNKRIKDIDIQISKLIDLYQVGSIPIEDITNRVNALKQEKDTLVENLRTPVADIGARKRKFVALLSEFDDVLRGGAIEERRMFVNSVIKSIVVNDESINIHWRI